MDTMLLISDCSRRGVQAVARIAEMIDEMELNPGQMGLIINRAPEGKLNPGVLEEIEKHGLKLLGVLPIAEMIDEMELNPGQMGLIINRAPEGKLNPGVLEEIEKHGLKLLGVLPHDDAVYNCDCNGDPSSKLPEADPMKQALRGIMQSIGL